MVFRTLNLRTVISDTKHTFRINSVAAINYLDDIQMFLGFRTILDIATHHSIDLIRLTRVPTLAANINYLRGRSAQLQLL